MERRQFIYIPLQSFPISARRNDRDTLVDGPPKEDSRLANTVLGGQTLANIVYWAWRRFGQRRQRGKALDLNIVLPQVGQEVRLLEVRVHLDLV